MDKNTKYIIICDQADPVQTLSPDDLKNVLQLLEESGAMNAATKAERPALDTLADKLIALADSAEEYRDLLNDFITEADALLEEISGMAGGADDEE